MMFTDNQTLREDLVVTIWDAYKDAHGIRPRFIDFDNMSLSELDEMCLRTCKQAEEAALERKQIELEQVEEFKDLLQKTQELGADDEETALRWLVQDEDIRGVLDIEHWIFGHGILFTQYGRDLTERLLRICQLGQFEH